MRLGISEWTNSVAVAPGKAGAMQEIKRLNVNKARGGNEEGSEASSERASMKWLKKLERSLKLDDYFRDCG